uniref:Uncharacterized protein n=1 Tax=Pithovirus LCPAC401 TaxID=2506595 RepID=A0A481ZA44_9VIRU|nr:MAG: hypothetical protein LCPAC401_02950 [Pithovirus LCPAC401]
MKIYLIPIVNKEMTVALDPKNFNTPYLLFALKTKMGLDNVIPMFNREVNYDRFTVELYKGTVKQSIWDVDKLQDIIDHWLDNHRDECLLMSKDFKIEGIPSTWIRDMIPTINISGYPTSLDEGKLYIKLDPYKDYSSTYANFNVNIVETLERMYREGFIYGFDLPEWNLEYLGNNFYKPRWNNCMYAKNMVSFLTQRFVGEKETYFDLGTNNNVVRHFIAIGLDGCKFVSNRLIIEVDGFNDAESVSEYIKKTIRESHGSVTLKVFRTKQVGQKGVMYTTDDIHFPFTVSLLEESDTEE